MDNSAKINLDPSKTGTDAYIEYFHYLKNYPLYHGLTESVLSTFIYTPKKNPRIKDQLFQIKFGLPDFPSNLAPKPTLLCANSLKDRAYVCYDCQQNSRGFLCSQCFLRGNHHVKCRFEVKQLPPALHNFYQCTCGDCSKMSYRGTCPDHRNFALQLLSTDKLKDFYEYISGCLKFLIVLVSAGEQLKTKDPKNEDIDHMQYIGRCYGKALFDFLQNINKNTHQLLAVTQKSLLQQIHPNQRAGVVPKQQETKESCSIMSIILEKYVNKSDSFIYDCIGELLQLENKDLLACVFEDAVKCQKPFVRSSRLKYLKQMRTKSKIQPQTFCQLVNQFRDQIEQNDKAQALQLYTFAATPNAYLFKKQREQYSLVEGFESLFKKSYLTIENILLQKTTSILAVLSNLVYNKGLFVSLLAQLVDYTYEKLVAKYVKMNEVGRKISLSEMCNVITKLIYQHLQGDWNQSAQFLSQLQMDNKILFIIYYFLVESLGNTSHLSQQTVFCFGLFLSKVQSSNQKQYQIYCKLWNQTSVPCQRFVDVLAKILNILIGQELKNLSKISVYREINQEQRQEIEKMQEQKFKQLLFMQRVIPKKQIEILLKENILNFERASKILQKYTTYNGQNKTFVYSHQENHFSFDGIVNGIFHMKEEAQNLVFDPEVEDGCFTVGKFQYRKAVVNGLLGPILSNFNRQVYTSNQMDVKLFKTVTHNHNYVRYVCLVIVDKITNGSIKELRKFLIAKRSELASQKPSADDSDLLKMQNLFASKSIQFKVQMQQKREKEQCSSQITGTRESVESIQHTPQKKLQETNQNSKKSEQQGSSSAIESPTKSGKGASKLQKLREKFQLKQASILNMYSSHTPAYKENVETCMTCKEENHSNNALFYLGVLKKQSPENRIFQSIYSCNYSINLCMHLIHESCFLKLSNGANFTCPLCKVSSNILLPLENHGVEKKTIEFLENRLTYAHIQLFNDYHADKWFIFLIKNIISEVSLYTIFNVILSHSQVHPQNQSKFQINKKLDYYLLILTQWWKAMEKEQRDYYAHKINGLLTDSGAKMQKTESDPKALVDEIVMNLMWEKILGRDTGKQICKQLNELERLIELKQFANLIKYLQQFRGSCLNYESQLVQAPEMKFINYYFNPPVSIALVQCQTSKCSGCKNPANKGNFYCLYCSCSYCLQCNHEKLHGNLRARINGKSGCFEYTDKKGKCYEATVYFNPWRIAWGAVEYGHDDYFGYELDHQLMNRALYDWVRELSN